MTQFTWLPFFEEMLSIICEKYDKQSLCDVFHQIFKGWGGTTDKYPDGTKGPLREIDPLSFISYFNRGITDANRMAFCQMAKTIFNMESEAPTDFDGVPAAQNQKTWLFDWEKGRQTYDVPNLWLFSKTINNDTIDNDIFLTVSKIKQTGIAKMTQLMFICKPDKYVSLDSRNREYFRGKGLFGGLDPRQEISDASRPYDRYLQLLEEIKQEFNRPLFEISREAYLFTPEVTERDKKIVELKDEDLGDGNLTKQKYWWLNANPKIWNFSDIKIGEKQTYTTHNEKGNKRRIYKHFTQVQHGDLIIGYLASPDKEITAICRVTKGLHENAEGESIEFEKTEDIAIPVTFGELKNEPGLSNCEPLINNQGSLFKLTAEEYDLIRSLIDEKNEAEHIVEVIPYSIENALEGVFLKREEFENILGVLQFKKNIILQGAPGVGKTYMAQRLAFALMGEKAPGRLQMIQFHQSYSYEDFIQGYRPNDNENFTLKNGVFHDFCKKAQRDPDHLYVFIIDEINRGNLSKIFGELMMLIEPDKRGKDFAVPLTYAQAADEKFYIPENLYLIGTMNTADRSLAMVDYALRRRFSFISLSPKYETPEFKSYLKSKGVKQELVDKIVSKMADLNLEISKDDKNLGVGYQIGHSFFCPADHLTRYDYNWYQRVVRHEILPLLEEYWFDNLENVSKHVKALLD